MPQTLAEWLVRTTVVLGLLPTLLLMVGVTRGGIDVVRQVFRTARRDDWSAQLLLVIASGGYLAFIALYGYRYRDFATMKALFICPAALAFLTSFARELERPGGPGRAKCLEAAYASTWLLAGGHRGCRHVGVSAARPATRR